MIHFFPPPIAAAVPPAPVNGTRRDDPRPWLMRLLCRACAPPPHPDLPTLALLDVVDRVRRVEAQMARDNVARAHAE